MQPVREQLADLSRRRTASRPRRAGGCRSGSDWRPPSSPPVARFGLSPRPVPDRRDSSKNITVCSWRIRPEYSMQEVDVRRAALRGAGLDGAEAIDAVGVGRGAAPAEEVRDCRSGPRRRPARSRAPRCRAACRRACTTRPVISIASPWPPARRRGRSRPARTRAGRTARASSRRWASRRFTAAPRRPCGRAPRAGTRRPARCRASRSARGARCSGSRACGSRIGVEDRRRAR